MHNDYQMELEPQFIGHIQVITWWRHQMETFSALLALCAGNSPVPGEFPPQRSVTRSFDVIFDLHRNKRLSKQSWGWWFETLPRLLRRHSNDMYIQTQCGIIIMRPVPLWWRHNECDGVSNHRRLDCLFNRLFRRRSKKTSKLRVTGLFEENPRHRWIPLTEGR